MDIAEKFIITKNKISLKDHPTDQTFDYKKDDAIAVLDDIKKQIFDLHEKLYAVNRNALLIVFQAMDAAGKDSAIKHVMSGLNPQGVQVTSFKQPSSKEYAHDFLWRHYKALPPKGHIGIHNRSHYENVLVTRVHPEIILNERLPGITSTSDIKKSFWKDRFESIKNFEKHVAENGTIIIKFFLHVSKEEQKERFLERIDDKQKNWKFSAQDVSERQLWEKYMDNYEEAIAETSTVYAPWYVIPADKKWFTRIAISDIILKTLQTFDMKIEPLSDDEKAELEENKKLLMEEK